MRRKLAALLPALAALTICAGLAAPRAPGTVTIAPAATTSADDSWPDAGPIPCCKA